MVERLFPSQWAPLVGREDELGRLLVALDKADAGQSGLVLVSGEPGIGKTRLVEELAERAEARGALVVWGRVDEVEGAPPYWPWVQVLCAVLTDCDRDVVSEALEADAGVIAAILPDVKEYVAEVIPPPVLDPAEARFRLHQAVVDFFRRLSRVRPVVIALEDAHWGDVASLELTRFAAARLSSAPVLLVVTYRSVDAGSSEAFDDVLATLARHPRLERIALTGLNLSEVGHFIAQTVDAAPAAAAVSAVHARTEGNPFFVTELARLLKSEGRLGGASDGEASPGAVPAGVRDVLRRRVARLPGATRELLALGAVVGREFDVSVIAAAAGIDVVHVLDRMDPAIGAGLVSEIASSVGKLRFSHALVRDTLYGELSAPRRAVVHAEVGEALERHASPRTRLAELAGHFVHAAPVVGPERGLAYTLAAAEAAQAALAYEQAEDDLRRALNLIQRLAVGPARLEQELHVQNRLAALLTKVRGHADPEVGRARARARELSHEVGQPEDRIAALWGLTNFHVVHGDYGIVTDLAGQLLTIGEQHASAVARVLGHVSAGIAQPYFGQFADARVSFGMAASLARSLERTQELAEACLHHPLPLALAYMARYAWLAGDDAEARTVGDEAVQIARQIGHPYTVVFALYMSTQLAVLMGDAEAAEERAHEAIVLCESRGFVMLGAWVAIFHGWALAQQGRGEQGVTEITSALATHNANGARINTALFLGLLADAEQECGHGERAVSLVEEALVLARKAGDRVYLAELHRRHGQLVAVTGGGHVADAEASLREAISIAQAQGAVAFEQRAAAALASLHHDAAPGRVASAGPADGVGLSTRERQLLGLVGRGLTDKEIAASLVISLATVRSHLERIRDKTNRRRRAELTRLAVDLGLTNE